MLLIHLRQAAVDHLRLPIGPVLSQKNAKRTEGKRLVRPLKRSSVTSLTLDVEETAAESTGAAGLSNEEGPPACLDGERATPTARGLPAAQGGARDAAEPAHCSEGCRCMIYAL